MPGESNESAMRRRYSAIRLSELRHNLHSTRHGAIAGPQGVHRNPRRKNRPVDCRYTLMCASYFSLLRELNDY